MSKAVQLVLICGFLGMSSTTVTAEGSDDVDWTWNRERASALWSAVEHQSEYSVTLRTKPPRRAQVEVEIGTVEGGAVYRWSGHVFSVFKIIGDCLYYADFIPTASGGQVIAIDLTTGKEVWRHTLKALGPVQHSAYASRLNLSASEESITVFGLESAGRYIEVISADTGRLIDHRRLPPQEPGR